ncbi:hypothetical protein [Xanthomonas phage JGB6]|nr:hypothetical protein [Xanthomonas phage JGB6]
MTNAIAKAVTIGRRDEVIAERSEYGEQYLRTDNGRYKTMLICSDLHDKEIDPFFLRVMIDTAQRVQPDVVCYGGDVFDLPEFGRYGVDRVSGMLLVASSMSTTISSVRCVTQRLIPSSIWLKATTNACRRTPRF